jgi:hypothetical protein
MTYTLNAPNPNDSPAAQQPALSTNTNLVNTFFGTDHVTFTEASDQGEHIKVTLNDVQVDPVLASPKTQLYSKTVSGQEQLFFANASSVYQVTPPNVSAITVLGKCSTNGTGSSITLLPGSFNFNDPPVFTAPATYRIDFSTNLTTTQLAEAKVFVSVRQAPRNVFFAWDITASHVVVSFFKTDGSNASAPGLTTPNGITILVVQ